MPKEQLKSSPTQSSANNSGLLSLNAPNCTVSSLIGNAVLIGLEKAFGQDTKGYRFLFVPFNKGQLKTDLLTCPPVQNSDKM